MPPKSKRIQRYRKKKPTSGGYNWGRYVGYAGKALAVAYGVKKLLNVEYKENDVGLNYTQNTTATITDLMDIAQGDDKSARNGRSVLLKSLTGTLRLSAVAATSTTLTLMIVQDMKCDGTQYTAAQLHDTTGDPVNLLRNKDYVPQLRVLWRRIVQFDPNRLQNKILPINLKLNNHMKFIGTGSGIANNGRGNLTLFTLSNETTNVPTVYGAIRTSFIDN